MAEKRQGGGRKRRGRGEGAVYQRESDGLWVGSVSLGFDGRGRRKRKPVYARTKAAALEKMRQIQADQDAGRLVETEKLTAAEYLKRWLENTAKNKVEPTTWELYRQMVELHLVPVLGGVKLAKVAPIHVEQCYAELERKGASAYTRRAAGVVLSAALKHAAVKLKLIPFNPAADVTKAKLPGKEMLHLTERQAKLLLEAARPHRLYALFAVALGGGLRQGELLGLQWADVDFTAGTVKVGRSLAWVKGKPVLKEPKTKHSRRTIALPPFAVDALRSHRQAAQKAGLTAAPVFCTCTGTYIFKSNFVRRVFRPLVKKANQLDADRAAESKGQPDPLPAGLRFHDLRHTHASRLISGGHSVKAVSRRLGHAGIDITLKVYAHLMPDDDGKLAAAVEAMFG